MRNILLLLFTVGHISSFAQQINGQFTDFAVNNEWGNTVINTAIFQTTDHITLGGYYEGAQRSGVTGGVFFSYPNKIPMVLQITPSGAIRQDFAGPVGNVCFLSSVNSSMGSTEVDKIYIANTSTTGASNQLIISGRQEDSDGGGFYLKTFPTGTRPTAFNNGNTTILSGGGASTRGFIEDWVTGFTLYSVRLNGATFGNARVLLSTFNRNTGAPLASFGDAGTLSINAPDGYIVDYARPVRIAPGTTGNFYVAFSTIASIGNGTAVVLCGVNATTGSIDSTFGTNGFKTTATNSRNYLTSVVVNSNESITVGGYSDEGQQSVCSFTTFNTDGSLYISSFINEPIPGFGSKNIGAVPANINGEERIVYTYAKPFGTDGNYQIAIASLKPGSAVADPLIHTPWLGSEFVSAEPTCIIKTLNNSGFIVTGKATRTNGTFAGVVLKYTMTGLLDPSFANQGVLIINGRQGGSPWADVSHMPNGKYLVCGTAGFVPTALEKQALLLQRFNSNGSIDSSFGTNGTQYAFQSDYARSARQMVPLPDGKFLIGGTYTNYTNEPGIGTGVDGPKATIYKFNANGTPDLDFGPSNNGRFHFAGYIGMSPGEIQLVGNDIYFGGNSSITNDNGGRSMVLKLTSGGINNSSYSLNLRSMIEYRIDTSNFDLYASGRASAASTSSRYICRAKQSTGSPDLTYGTNGFAELPIINSGDNATVREMKPVAGGLLAMADWASATSGSNITYGIFFSFISSSGVVDNSFGTNGAKFLQLPGATSITRNLSKWVANGTRLLIFGESNAARTDKYFVCRVNLNGDLDTSFGTGGIIWTASSFLGARAFDNDGNLLAFKNGSFFYDGALQKMQIPADVYNRIKPGSWTGTIDSDWFKPGNWAEGVVPDAYTEVVITNGSVLIGSGQQAFAYSVRVLGGANLSMGTNSTLKITKYNP